VILLLQKTLGNVFAISINSKTTYSFSYTKGKDRLRDWARTQLCMYACLKNRCLHSIGDKKLVKYMIYAKNAKQECSINIFACLENIFAGFEQNFEELKMFIMQDSFSSYNSHFLF